MNKALENGVERSRSLLFRLQSKYVDWYIQEIHVHPKISQESIQNSNPGLAVTELKTVTIKPPRI